MNNELYSLLHNCANRDGIPCMDNTMFSRVTSDYGREDFRLALAKYITNEKPPFPYKDYVWAAPRLLN